MRLPRNRWRRMSDRELLDAMLTLTAGVAFVLLGSLHYPEPLPLILTLAGVALIVIA